MAGIDLSGIANAVKSVATSALPTLLSVAGHALGLGGPADAIANAIKGATPEQKAALDAALAPHIEEMGRQAIELAKVDASLVQGAYDVDKAMLASGDRWTSRARPTSLYAATALTAFLVVVVGICLLKHTPIDWSGIGAMVALIAPLWGHGVVYTRARRDEKVAAINAAS